MLTKSLIRKISSVRPFVARAVGVRQFSADNDAMMKALVDGLASQQLESAKIVVPWFLKNMPANYLTETREELRNQHLKAVAAFRDISQSDIALKIENTAADGTITITHFDNSRSNSSVLANLNNVSVPPNHSLVGVKIYKTNDGSLSIQMFTYKPDINAIEHASVSDAAPILNAAAEVRGGEHAGDSSYPIDSPLFTDESLQEYFKLCTTVYCKNANPRRFLIQRKMYEEVRSTDKATVHVEASEDGSPAMWFTIAAANVLPDVLFRLASNVLMAKKFEVLQSHMDRVNDPSNDTAELPGFVTMLRLYVNTDMKHIAPEVLQDTVNALKRSKWYDEETVDFGLRRNPELGLDRAEVITGLCSLLHGPLSKTNAHAFSSIKSIIQTVDSDKKFIKMACQISELFLDKFRPDAAITENEYNRREKELREKFDHMQPQNARIDLTRVDEAKTVLNKMLDAVNCSKRTNFFNTDRYAFSIRLDPMIMATGTIGKAPNTPLPYGVYFAHGRHFNGFHNRFRDVARGGLRVVTPPNSDVYASESSKHFDECYNLSFAQQLKNKDIPEGGAKSVVLLNTPIIKPEARFFAARKAIRAFCDSCLDLMVKDSVAGLVDHLKKDELLYFGPDEQVIASDVEWITQRAQQRGYPNPGAFMSSKPAEGFNHKEFGVTSEGVVVFLDVALKKSLGIEPRTTPFSVKITGGPDGDVAGNLMKILIREYPNTVKIVGVADGFGVAEDPEGLDHGELLRLFKAGRPINEFSKDKLKTEGVMFDASTEEGAARRNSMVFRVKADAFVPGGGRPGTIDGDNWMNFLDDKGVPTSKLIVEGANLFNTAEARKHLHSKGVAIVKDSSANKCGVMTSSYEIQSSMLLSKQEFLDNKEALVADVLVKLREAANREAELLFREYNNYPGSLVDFSERISNAINKVTDAITLRLENVEPSDPLFKSLMPLIKENLPDKLAEMAWDRVPECMPVQYQRCAIASTLAAKLVYQEGIHLVEAQDDNMVAERAIAYYNADNRMKELVKELNDKDLGLSVSKKQEILGLLSKGGARTALDIF